MRTIRPIKDRILVRQDPPREKTNGGLYLANPDRSLQDDIGTVIAVGSDPDISVKVGDRIHFSRRPGSHLGDVDEEWKDLLMLRDSDVVAVIE